MSGTGLKQSSSGAAVAVFDFLSLSSGVGLLLALRQFRSLPIAGMTVIQTLLGGIAVILIAAGFKQLVTARRSTQRSRQFRQFNRYRVVLPREGIVYLTVMSVMLVASLMGRSNTLMLVFALMAGPFVVNGWITYTMLKRNSVSRTCPRRAMVGELISVQLDVRNRKLLFSTWLATARDRIVSASEDLDASTLFTRVPPRSFRRGYYQLRLNRRGRYRLGPIRLSTRFPLGLVERSQMFEAPGELLVHPRVGQLTDRWKQQMRVSAEFVHRPRTRKGTFNDDFHRIREFSPGDNPKLIHWRTSARRNELMVREYHQSRDQHLAVFVDLWQPAAPTSTDRDRVEYAVSFAATVCVDHLRHNREARLQVWVCGERITAWQASHGVSNVESVLDMLALVRAGASEPLDRMFREALPTIPSNARLVLITTRRELSDRPDTADDDALRRLRLPDEMSGQLRVFRAEPKELQAFFLLP